MEQTLSEEQLNENEKIKWLRWIVDLNIARLYQERILDLDAGRSLVRAVRKQVLDVFPDKSSTFDLVLLPRFNRVLFERWGKGFDEDIH